MNAEPAKINTNSFRLTLELRVLKATARARFCALLLPFPTSNSFPRRRSLALSSSSSSRLSPPPRSLSLSLVLRPPLTVTGWLVDWLFLGGGKEGREGDYHERPAARSWPRPPRARPPPADSHFPHSFASKARFLPQSLGEALPLRFASFLPVEEGGHGAALATKATAVERELEQTHSRAGRDTEVREEGRIRYTMIRRYECR